MGEILHKTVLVNWTEHVSQQYHVSLEKRSKNKLENEAISRIMQDSKSKKNQG